MKKYWEKLTLSEKGLMSRKKRPTFSRPLRNVVIMTSKLCQLPSNFPGSQIVRISPKRDLS